MDLRITTGHDDLSSNSEGDATIVFQNGKTLNLSGANALKPQGIEWQRGAVVAQTIPLADYLCTNGICGPDDLPTGNTGVESVTFNLIEDTSESDYVDNWDIGGLNVRLFQEPASSGDGEWCEFDLGGSSSYGAHELQDNHVGIARLSAYQGNSGIGTQVTFAASGTPSETNLVGTNCNRPTGSPVPVTPAQMQFILATGSHALGHGSGLYADLYIGGSVVQTYTLKEPNSPTWNNDTEQNYSVRLADACPGLRDAALTSKRVQ
jgi:hypothetical protein